MANSGKRYAGSIAGHFDCLLRVNFPLVEKQSVTILGCVDKFSIRRNRRF